MRRLRPLLRCLPAVLLAAAAQAQPPPAAVTGTVVDGVTGDPIPNAAVASGAETAATGAGGRFTVTLAPGDAELRITAAGYLDAAVPVNPVATRPRPALEVALFRRRSSGSS